MDFKLQQKTIECSAEIIYEFAFENKNVNKNLLEYFSINVDDFKNANSKGKLQIIKEATKSLYDKNAILFKQKQAEIDQLLTKRQKEIEKILSQTFNLLINKTIKVYLGVCPICPRYLNDFSFDICIFESNEGILQTIIHELIHFYWFAKMENMGYKLSAQDKECPSLPWLITEIVVDSIFKNTNLKQFLFNQEPAYHVFYSATINGQNLIESFNNMFAASQNIEEFISATMEFMEENKTELANLKINF